MEKSFSYPKVSVIIPVYNGEALIENCIKHLSSQNYPKDKLEIIVVDNNSTDNTYEIARKCGIITLICKTKGPSAARNMGIKAAAGDLLLFTDADCLADVNWVINHVLAQLYFEAVNPAVKLIGGGIGGKNGNLWAVCDDICSWAEFNPSLPPGIIERHHPTANISISRNIADEMGGFDEVLLTGEDFAFCSKIREKGYQMFFVPDAKVLHINRTTFRGVMRHHLEWSEHSYKLLPRHHQALLENMLMRWFVFCFTLAKNTLKAVMLSIRAKRLAALLLLPAVFINRLVFSYGLLKSARTYLKKQKSKYSAAE
jgi:glycosyltransferase involved in cell wall biosynthesis